MSSKFIDIHTHNNLQNDTTFRLVNTIVSKDKYPDSICSAGIHPWYIDENIELQFNTLQELAAHRNTIAIGECGLDKMCTIAWETQIDIFERQITLANQLNKPLIIHCVKAYAETLQLLKKARIPVIFHGFNKNIALANQILQQNHYISLGGDIINGRLDEHIQTLPTDRIFLETDNKSIEIVDIFTYFCGVRKLEVTQLKQQIALNFEQVFKFSI